MIESDTEEEDKERE